jgi:hypothetical protein
MRDHLQKEKAASSELGGLLKVHKREGNTPGSFPQANNLQSLGFLLKRIVEGLSHKSWENLGRIQHGK